TAPKSLQDTTTFPQQATNLLSTRFAIFAAEKPFASLMRTNQLITVKNCSQMQKLLLWVWHSVRSMSKPRRHLPPIQIQYFDGWISVIVAFFVGSFMVLYTGPDGFGDAIRDWDF